MKVIVTGFNPFGSHAVNPSQEAVIDLPDFVKIDDDKDVALVKLPLPTCCLEAFETLNAKMSECGGEPFAIVLAGLADSRSKISLERFALNVRYFPIPDNNGHEWDQDSIFPQGPDALRTRVKLRDLAQRLENCGFSVETSNHAGTYVCNETYYRALFCWQNSPNCRGIIFVHLPPYSAYAGVADKPLEGGASRSIYADALKEIVCYLAAQKSEPDFAI